MDLDLNDRVAVVTAASKGIGLAVAQRLLAEGARVVTASRTAAPELADLHVGRHLHVPVDLTHPEAPGEVIKAATDAWGRVDILVNNMGGGPEVHGPRSSFLDTTDADWQFTLNLNLFTAIRAARAALPSMLGRGAGAIVNITSVNARRPLPMVVDYSAAKSAVLNLTKALSEEFAPRGVRVNAISPGPVRTPFWTADGAMGDAVAAGAGVDRDALISTVLPEQMQLSTGSMATSEEIAVLTALLASPLAPNATGAEFIVDSGFLKNY